MSKFSAFVPFLITLVALGCGSGPEKGVNKDKDKPIPEKAQRKPADAKPSDGKALEAKDGKKTDDAKDAKDAKKP
ncbi:MAG: hypothetical protein U0744_10590 [Gemmataceae bacterium]